MARRTIALLMCLCILIPMYMVSTAAANTGRDPDAYEVSAQDAIPLPTELEMPGTPSLGDNRYYNYSQIKFYCTTPDSVTEYLHNTLDMYYGDEDGKRNGANTDYTWSVYGRGYSNFSVHLQTDFFFDNGSWQYTSDWDALSSYPELNGVTYDSEIYDKNCTDVTLLNAYSDGEDIVSGLSGWVDCFNKGTDGSNSVYTFNSQSHSISARARYVAEYYDAAADEYKYIYSPWSVTAMYGKNAIGNADVVTEATEIAAPVLSSGYVTTANSTEDYYLCMNVTAPDNLKKALMFDPSEKAINDVYYYNNVSLDLEASVDGETWFPIHKIDAFDTRVHSYYGCNLKSLFSSLYGTSDGFNWDGRDVNVRARYTVFYSYNDSSIGSATFKSPYSEPLVFDVPVIGRYGVSIDHQVTGDAAYNADSSSVSRTVLKNGSLSVSCVPVTGCYVSRVMKDGVCIYDRANESAATIVWDDESNKIRFELSDISSDTAIVITYGGTPTAEKTVTVSCGEGGTYSFDFDNPSATNGDTYTLNIPYAATVTIRSDDYHVIDTVTCDGVAVPFPENAISVPVSFTGSSDSHSVSATFKRTAYALTVSATPGEYEAFFNPGSYNNGVIPIGQSVTVSFHSLPGYEISEVKIDNVPNTDAREKGSYTFDNYNADHVISLTTVATAPVIWHEISVSCGANGTTSASQEINPIIEGENFSVTFIPNAGYTIDTVTVDGTPVTNFVGNTYYINDVKAAHTISVTFKTAPEKYTVSISKSGFNHAKNTVSPVGDVQVNTNASLTVTYAPYYPGAVDKLIVDGVEQPAGADGKWTFENITANHTLEVVFKFVPRKGDLDKDGDVTTSDARIALRVAASLDASDAYIDEYGEVADNDGKITTSDARLILRVAAQLEKF